MLFVLQARWEMNHTFTGGSVLMGGAHIVSVNTYHGTHLLLRSRVGSDYGIIFHGKTPDCILLT